MGVEMELSSSGIYNLLEQALGCSVDACDCVPINQGNSGALVARITGCITTGKSFSAVLKSRRSECIHKALWYSQDNVMIDREYHLYGLLEDRCIPHACILARSYDAPSDWNLLLEDLDQDYVLPPLDYQFSESEQDLIIATYVELHSRTFGIDREPIAEYLQVEEGQQVNEATAEQMIDTFNRSTFEFSVDEFRQAVGILLKIRDHWRDAPRCLVFNDFYPGNVALPKSGNGYAVLFDWELAGVGLPHFDLINLGFHRERSTAIYTEQMQRRGLKLDMEKFREQFAYADLSMHFYTLWLLHLKLQADPEGRLPGWMQNIASSLFGGRLILMARQAEC